MVTDAKDENIAMYIGLIVAVAVFITIIIVVVVLVRRRQQQAGNYEYDCTTSSKYNVHDSVLMSVCKVLQGDPFTFI